MIKNLKIPHVFALLAIVIIAASLLSYIVPSGSFEREEIAVGNLSRTEVIPGSYQAIAKHYSIKGFFLGDEVTGKATPVGLMGFLTAIPKGLEQTADIIFFIFLIGGVFSIVKRTGTITASIQALINRFNNNGTILTVLLMLVIAAGGSTLGMAEEFIPLVPVFLYISHKLGYDKIYGLALVFVSAEIGFAAATTNPFNVQIAQGIAEVPLGSGIAFRLVFFVFSLAVAILYMLRYGKRLKENPANSYLGEDNTYQEEVLEEFKLTKNHIRIVLVCGLLFVGILWAVQTQGWWMAEMGAGFLAIGIVAAILGKLSLDQATKAFVSGMSEMLVGALVVGFAKGIQVVLVEGQIMDSVIYYASNTLQYLPKILAAEGMLVFQTILNFFIPSGSGQAATTIPLMAPLADLLGITRNTAIFAFTCGDGFANTVIPTSGILMAMLGIANIPFKNWLKFMLPLFGWLIVLSAIFLAIAVLIEY
ncbi:YfcC family protein [Labilibaculum sp.]|uniref:YfcC family protein n=1 Tax=Labilibaculum sp. TaxID=2060723 RepID=UPI0035655DB8